MSTAARIDPPPLKGLTLALIAFALALGTFMQVLDGTVANVSLPTISGNLGASTSQGTWIVTSFAVSNGIAVPLTGWLMGRFGVVRTFVASVILFTIASFLCGIAWNLSSLVVFRVLQGAVSGPMIPGSQALLLSIFPANRRGSALGVWSMTTLIGPVMGPIVGGYISDNYHWSWIFLINIPFGIFCGVICWIGLKSRETPTRKLPIDAVGMALLILWVGLLQVVLDMGKDLDWFHSTFVTVASIAVAILFIAWIIWELTDKHPSVDLRLFRFRNFTFGTIAFCLGYAFLFATVLLTPLWLQTQIGYTATWSGLVAAPSGLVALCCTPFVAWIINRYDPRPVVTLSFVAFGLSFLMRTWFSTNDDFWTYTLPMLVQGLGMAGFFVTMATLLIDRIPTADIPSATGISNFARLTTGSFAASIITTFWDRREALHQTHMVDSFTLFSPPYQGAIETLQQLGLNHEQASGMVMAQIVQQAYQLSTNDLFWFSALGSFAMVGMVWLTRRPEKL